MSDKVTVDDALPVTSVTSVRRETDFEAGLRALSAYGIAAAAMALVLVGVVASFALAVLSDRHATAGFQLFSSLVSLAAGYLFATQANKT